MTHRFHPGALQEFEESVRYYHARRQGLGNRFADEVRSTIRRIVDAPERWRVVEEDVRRCAVRVFPYSVLYTIEPESILIVAVMHNKRQPVYWRYRLGIDQE